MILSFRSLAFCVGVALLVTAGARIRAAESGDDSAAGLPPTYAKNFLVSKNTLSPDKNFAVIYPTLDFSESPKAKDFLVMLKPFSVLAPLPTKDPYFQNRSHGGLSAEWSKDGSVALITLDSKWGPGDVFVVELSNGKVKRITNILEKLTQLLLPKFRAATPKKEPFNDNYPFIFEQEEGSACTLEGNGSVKIDTTATNDPKDMSDRSWTVRVKAEWDIAQAKFTSQKITTDHR